MKLGIILWKIDPLKAKGFPDFPTPFSPVHKALKFSEVLGTTFPNNPIIISCVSYPSISILNYNLLVIS